MLRSYNSLTIALFALLLSTPAYGSGQESATAEQKRAAQKMFEAADGLYENGQYEQAAQAFRASYDLVASPNSRLMIARSLRELQRYEEAYQEYQATLHDAEASAGRYPDTLRAAQAEAEALSEQLAYLVIDSAPGNTELRINGKATKFVPGERVAVLASKADLEFRFPDGKVTHEALDLKKQETQHVKATPEPAITPAPQASPPAIEKKAEAPRVEHSNGWHTAAYIASAVGATGLVTFGVFGVLDKSTYSNLQSKCSSASCAPGTNDQIDKGRMYQTVANIGLGVAVVGATAAVTLFFVSPSHSEQPVALQVGPGNVSLKGSF